MLDAILRLAFGAGLVVALAVRWPAARRRRGSQLAEDRATAAERALLALYFVAIVLVPLAYLATRGLGFADFGVTGAAKLALGLLGVSAFAVGDWLLWRSHADLGRNWSAEVQLQAGQGLVTSGVYRQIRHPMYAAHWLIGLGQLLLLQNWIAGPANLLVFAALYLVRVPREERLMREAFGARYEEYVSRTGRVIPPLGKRRLL